VQVAATLGLQPGLALHAVSAGLEGAPEAIAEHGGRSVALAGLDLTLALVALVRTLGVHDDAGVIDRGRLSVIDHAHGGIVRRRRDWAAD